MFSIAMHRTAYCDASNRILNSASVARSIPLRERIFAPTFLVPNSLSPSPAPPPKAVSPPTVPPSSPVASRSPQKNAAPRATRKYANLQTLPPLSALTYYRRNITRTLPVGGALIISVFLIASIVTLLNSVDRSITTHYGFLGRFSALTTQLERDVSPQMLNKVRAQPGWKKIIPALPYYLTIRTVFGEMPVPIYGVDQGQAPVLAQETGNRLVEGRWPRPNEAEIVLSRTWFNNFGKRLGGSIDPGKGRLAMPFPKQKIVGILEGGANIALADRSYLQLELPVGVQRTSYLLIPSDPRQLNKLSAQLEDFKNHPTKHGLSEENTRYAKIFTFMGLVTELRNSLEFLYKFLAIADGLVIGAVALMGGFLANIYFEQRLGEFGLLSAFGFRRELLARRVLVETSILVIAGWVVGIVFTWLIFRGIDAFYMAPKGLILAPLDSLALRYTTPTPLIVGAASLATVLFRLYRMDPIEIMERR